MRLDYVLDLGMIMFCLWVVYTLMSDGQHVGWNVYYTVEPILFKLSHVFGY